MPDTPASATNAARAIAGALIRHAITAAGTVLVARGWLDKQTADSATGPIADYLFGAGLAIGSASWGAAKAKILHTRLASAWLALSQRA